MGDYYEEKLQRSGKELKGCFFCFLAMVLIGIAGFLWGRYTTPPSKNTSDTIEVVRTDTIRDTIPQYHYEKITKYISVPDSILIRDTITNELVLPIVQRTYTDDSTYTAYISGAKVDSFPRLDSIDVYQKTIERTITNTIYKTKHWRFGVGASAWISPVIAILSRGEVLLFYMMKGPYKRLVFLSLLFLFGLPISCFCSTNLKFGARLCHNSGLCRKSPGDTPK